MSAIVYSLIHSFIHSTGIYCWLSRTSFQLIITSGAASLFIVWLRIGKLFVYPF